MESCGLDFDQHFSFRYYQKIALVKIDISADLSIMSVMPMHIGRALNVDTVCRSVHLDIPKQKKSDNFLVRKSTF